jgi:hypothetical protein
MKKVTGIGGVFIKTKEPDKLREWYSTHLGIENSQYGATFEWFKENGEKGSLHGHCLKKAATILIRLINHS